MTELTIDQALQQGIEAHKAGQVQEADRLYTAILKAQPKHPDANHNMGVLAVGVGKVQEALPFFKTALEANPATAQFWLSYIDTLIKLGKLADAQAVLDQAKSKGAKGDGFDKLEQRLKDAGQEPLEANQIASEPQPKQPNILDSLKLDQALKLAKKKAKAGSPEEAKRIYQDILTKFPKNKRASDGLKGLAGKTVGKASKDQNPPQDQLQSLINLYSQGQLQQALKQAETLIPQFPQSATLFNIQGAALKGLGQLDASVEAYNKALAIKPDYDEAYNNMGNALKDQGKLEEAIDAYNKALAIKPDYAEAHMNLSFLLLNTNRLSDGFAEQEWRWKTKERLKDKRYFSQPIWNGKTSLKGKRILLWCEQGIGDTINWSHCLPFLASQAQHCILECQEKLIPLMARSFPNVEVKAENRSLDSKRDDFDFHLPMGSLFQHFVSKISSSGKADAFLVPDPVRVNFWKKRLHSIGNGPYVGISWKSSDMKRSRLPNYAPIFELSPVLTLPGITFINLQSTDFYDDLAKVKNDLGISVHNFDDLDHYDNLDDVAALSSALDLVVSTHNALPIITAGVGTPTWLASWEQSSWNNILFSPHGPHIRKFQKNTWEPWDGLFRLISQDILLDIGQ